VLIKRGAKPCRRSTAGKIFARRSPIIALAIYAAVMGLAFATLFSEIIAPGCGTIVGKRGALARQCWSVNAAIKTRSTRPNNARFHERFLI
jgi:hypothetical protein